MSAACHQILKYTFTLLIPIYGSLVRLRRSASTTRYEKQDGEDGEDEEEETRLLVVYCNVFITRSYNLLGNF